jgi:AcrR family transcriptional regulator
MHAMSSTAATIVEEKVDGRRLRGERTHKRIIDAVIQLVAEGGSHLPLEMTAARAHVTVRTIFQHFHDLGTLYLSAADAQLRGLLADLPPMKTDGTLEARVAALVSERAELAEHTLPMRKRAARFGTSSDAATAPARFGHDVQRRRCEVAFKTELAQVPETERDQLLDAIHAATAWTLLRTKLDASQAEQVWYRLVRALMRDAIVTGAGHRSSGIG